MTGMPRRKRKRKRGLKAVRNLRIEQIFERLLFGMKRFYISKTARRVAMGLFFLFCYLIVLAADFIPDKISVTEGEVSDRDIAATRTVSYIDAEKTKKLENEVLESVANVYDLDVSVLFKAEEQVNAIFNVLYSVASTKEYAEAEPAQQAEYKRKALAEVMKIGLENRSVEILIHADDPALQAMKTHTLEILRKYLQRGIHTDEIELARRYVMDEIAASAAAVDGQAVEQDFVRQLLHPNMILNEKETEKRKQAAIASVEPVRETIRKGQVIVRYGDIITRQQIAMMEEAGLYKSQVNGSRFLGLLVFVLTCLALILGYLYRFERKVYKNDAKLLLLGLIVLIALCLGKLAHYYSYFAGPVSAGALLAAVLLSPRIGLVVSVALAVLFGIIVEYDLRAVVSTLVGSMIGIYSVARLAHGYNLIRTGLLIAASNFLVICSMGMMLQNDGTQLLLQGLIGAVSGIGAAVITTGVLPYLEHAFNITTPIKLLELGQPNQPLMQRLLLEAPGTYHHSVLLGNLAEAAADAIGADPVVVRVGSYYHDIGKIKRPYFFVENQFGAENPHDKLAPSLSTLIITSHVKDGLDLCREYKLPPVIADIIAQHHGTLLASFFYRKAQEQQHNESVLEKDFRYEGPKPQTKEAALIMIADACEAAVRSISKPNVNRIEAMVRKVVKERLNDGQFDECDLTLRDLTMIGDVYIRILSSMFHSRIEYPDGLKGIERKPNKNGNCIKQLPAGSGSAAGSAASCDEGAGNRS